MAKGKPQKETVLDFIKWTLTKGQAIVKEAGYVHIEQSNIENYLSKIKVQ